MTYVKTDWETGDIITAEKLNNMESGIENAGSGSTGTVMVVHSTSDESTGNTTLDKTWAEIADAMQTGIVVHVYSWGEDGYMCAYLDYVENDSGLYHAVFLVEGEQQQFVTTSTTGYPVRGV